MSLTSRLFIDDGPAAGFKILSYDFSFSQEVDNRGMVSSKVRAGLFHVTIPGTDDPNILEWMLSNDLKKNGRISFSGYDNSGGQPRNVIFKDAVLVNYREVYSDPSDIVISLTISSRIIKMPNSEYTSQWAIPGG
jgi:hypothetical protein